MKLHHTFLVGFCIGLPPPALAADATPAPFPVPPYFLDGAPGTPDPDHIDMVAGSRLELSDGFALQGPLHVQRPDPADPGDPPTDPLPAIWRVDLGEAAFARLVRIDAPVVKDGAGTLRLAEIGSSTWGDTLALREGGLRVDGWWSGGAIHTSPGTVLSGSGSIFSARVGGVLQPGGPDASGTLYFPQGLQLEPSATTRIRIAADGRADSIASPAGTLRLGGTLQVTPTAGAWTPRDRWVIAEAAGGLQLGAPQAPDDVAGDGRFAQAYSTLRYLDPVLTYEPGRVILGLAYNQQTLNTADGAWRSALLEDSRFVRESALAHVRDDGAWLQGWYASTDRAGAGGLPPDTRDLHGLQAGVSRAVGRWHFAAFAGWQSTRLDSRPDPAAQPYRVRDTAGHVGLGLARSMGPVDLTLGIAHGWHHARLRRQADPAEPWARSRSRAGLTQAWMEARLQPQPVAGDWALSPYGRLAWLHLRRPGTGETGSLAAMRLSAQADTRWASHLGLTVQRSLPAAHDQDAVVRLDLGVQSLWGSRTLHTPQAPVGDPDQRLTIAGPPLARHVLALDLGARAPLTPRLRVNLAYTGRHGSGTHQHGVWLGVDLALDGKHRRGG